MVGFHNGDRKGCMIQPLHFTGASSAGNSETVGSSSKKKPDKHRCSCGNSSLSAAERWNYTAHFPLSRSVSLSASVLPQQLGFNASFLYSFLLLCSFGFFSFLLFS